MKPIVIYIDKNSSKITLTKEEFERHLKDAYDNGYSDGYTEGRKNNIWWNYNTITNTPSTPSIRYTSTTPIKNPDYTTITCEAHNTIGE